VLLGQLVSRYSRRPWWDRLVGASSILLGLLYLTDFHAVITDWPGSPLWVHWVLLLGMCVVQTFRKTHPVRALNAGVVIAVGDIVAGISIPVLIVLIDLIFNAVLYSSRRAVRWIVRVSIVFVAALGVLSSLTVPGWRNAVFATFNGFSLVIVPIWWAHSVRQQTDIAEAEREKTRQLAERGRMARDLHDVIAGHLSAIAIQSEAALSIMESDPALVRTVLRSVRENSVQSLTEMRAMIEVLKDGEDARTAPARLAELDRLVTSAEAGGLTVTTDVSDVDGLPVAVDLAAYRIVQEALTNVLKHAPGGYVDVVIAGSGDELVVEVTNTLPNGVADGAGTGLVSMRERAEVVGGLFVAGPRQDHRGERWRVRAVLPKGDEPG
jgi:signal transduction histidine kinase